MRSELSRQEVEQRRIEQRSYRGDIIDVDASCTGPTERQPILTEYLRTVLSRRWLALAIFLLCIAASVILLATRTPMYRATRRVLIQPGRPQTLPGIEQVYEEIGMIGGSTESSLNTQYKLLLGPDVLEGTLDDQTLNLAALPEFQKQNRLKVFASFFEISPVRQTYLVDVSFIWPDPEEGAKIVNKLVEHYIKDHNHRRLGVTQASLDTLKQEMKKLRPEADEALLRRQAFMKERNMASLQEDQSIKSNQYRDIMHKVSELRSERSRLESRMESIKKAMTEEGAAEYLPEVVNNDTMRELKMSLMARQEKHSDLLSRLGTKHDAVITAAARIKAIEKKMRGEARAILAAAQAELDRMVYQELDHRSQREILNKEMIKYAEIKANYDQLCEDAENKKEIAERVVKRIREIELSLATGDKEKNIFPLGEASIPIKASSPQKKAYLFMGAFIGLILAVGSCFLLDYLDTTVKTREDVEQLLGLPVLGYVPALDGVGKAEQDFGQTNRARDFMAIDEPHSILAESFRSIRTSLSLSSSGNEGTTLMAVTSASPKAGKSIVSINLALALARAGKKVLLVDADMRKPRHHKTFEINPNPGLSNLLAGHKDVPLELAIRATDVANLSLLPSGPIPPNPAELLDSPMFAELLNSFPDELDYVIFDTPPVANVTDAVILSARMHRVIMVVRSFRTQKNMLRRTAQTLQMAHGAAKAVILNNADLPRGTYAYYDNYYYQQYQYYYDEGQDKRRRKKKVKRSRSTSVANLKELASSDLLEETASKS